MGMDVLIAALPIAEGVQPNWTAASQTLTEMTDEALEDLAATLFTTDFEDTQAPAVRAALKDVIDRVDEAISSGSRELSAIEVPGWLIYVSGGASWGEPPTGLFEDFHDLDEAGLSTVAGFYVGDAAEASGRARLDLHA